MGIHTIMATAASYMEDFGLDREAQIVSQWEGAPKDVVVKALYTAALHAQKMMRQNVDDANDLYMAVTDAKKAFAPVNFSESKINNRKNVKRLTESNLKRIISESVKKVLKERTQK